MKAKTSLRFFLALSGSTLLAISSVNATQFWDGTGGDANWNTAGNWGGDVIPDWNTIINFGSLSSAAGTGFGNVTVPSQTTANNNLTAGTLIVGINFGNNGQANRTDAYTLQGNSIAFGNATNQTIGTAALHAAAIVSSIEDVVTLNIDLGSPGGAQNRQFQALANHHLKIDGVISGGANAVVLARVNGSKLTFTNANNSYLGATNIAEGFSGAAESVLEITSIANGGSNSSIGASSNAASNLRFNSGFNDTSLTTLRYIGAADASTDRLFTLYGNISGTNSRIESSGEGTLSFTNTGAIASGHQRARNFYLGGTNTGDNTFASTLSDFTEVSTFTKQGVGKWIITGSHGYTGVTTVSEGTLVVNGSISSSILTTVDSGATIAGSGTIGALTVSSGGFINPGNSPDVLDVVGAYTQAGTYNAEITGNTVGNGTTGYDQINVTGAVDITDGSLVATFSNGGYALNDLIFILLNDGTDAITGTYSGYADGATVATHDGFNWNISYSANSETSSFTGGNDIALMAVAIPEPEAALLGALGVLLLLRRRRS